VLAVCNGFQIACEAGLLPGALLRNAALSFLSMPVHLRVESTDSMFTHGYERAQVLTMPIAHGEGRYTADDETLDRLEGDGRVAFRYVTAAGVLAAGANPNGSMREIAGIVSEGGNVLGMMPHPERAAERVLGSEDGLPLLQAMLARVSA
ncbi:MAG: phosphoribosylformylglycinamidine synthase I, partial [Gemmatimonadaceae bacterium]